jgi:flavin reductase (DIM6/NTAB) family NADH-FMN oxidoreductase RutF
MVKRRAGVPTRCSRVAGAARPQGRNGLEGTQLRMPLDTAEFRRVMGHWLTGVAIVAARHADGRPCGMTANAVTSLSLEPPLLLVCIERAADTHDCIRDAGSFAVSVLARGDEALARRFAVLAAGDRFAGVPFLAAGSGSPILEAALAWIDCRLAAVHPGGDHSIFVGEVLDAGTRDGEPLAFFRGVYGGV